MNNIPEDVKIYWLDDVARLEATLDTPDDLYAMPVEELRWRLENRIVFDDTHCDPKR